MLKDIVDQYNQGIGYREVSYREIPIGIIQTFSDWLDKDRGYHGGHQVLRHVFHDLLYRDRYVFICTNKYNELDSYVITLDAYDMRAFYIKRQRDWVSINRGEFVQN